MKMINRNYAVLVLLLFFSLLSLSSSAFAYEENNLIVSSGIEADNLVTFGSSILASILFFITIVAYKRDKRKRLLYVSTAFFLFAVKGFLLTSDIFFPQKAGWVDLTASLLDFAILTSFFVGILKK